MMRYTVPFFLGVVVGCATFLFSTSQKVQQAEDHLAALRADLAQERQSARVLRAEWDYLNRPDRLEALARQYLDLQPPASDALLASLDDLKVLPEEDPPAPAEKIGARPGSRVAVADAPLIPPPIATKASPAPAARAVSGKAALPAKPEEKAVVFSANTPVPPPTPVQRVRRSFEEVLARIEPMGGAR